MSKKTYFQYQSEANIPIYISVDLAEFEAVLPDFLTKLRFTRIAEKDEAQTLQVIKKNNDVRLLNLTEASPNVAKQIKIIKVSDHFGPESVIPQNGYRVYRYKDLAMMVYSFGVKEWQIGCMKDFGTKDFELASKMILNRFLTWAFIPQGIVGLWGVGVDDGIVVQKANESKSEAVFVDVFNYRLFTQDGIKKLQPNFPIMRLDPMLKGRNVRMTSEQHLSFLSTHCTFFDSAGLSIPVRQMLQELSKFSIGILHPQESFRPRTDLSL